MNSPGVSSSTFRKLYRAALMIGVGAAATPIAAQTGWTQWTTGAGANNHWYLAVYVPGGINWADARQKAQALGGDLATITSAAENTFVFQRISNPIFWRVVQNPTRIFGPWLGGFQPAGSPEPTGGWTWVTGEPWGFTRWANGEPNNYQGLQEDQLHFFIGGTTPQDRWNDLRGTSLVPGFVVESVTPPLAAYVSLGSGCAPTGSQPATLLPALAGVDLPRLGTTSRLQLGNLPPATLFAVVAAGLTNRYADSSSGVVALPVSLQPLGWAGCTLQVAPQHLTGHVPAAPAVDYFVVVPNDTSLLGRSVFFQGLALATTGTTVTSSLAGYLGT
jgi:hypothetical protein